MIVELDMLDHVVLDEKRQCMIMLIFDIESLWEVEDDTGIFHFQHARKVKEKRLEHLIYLKKKVENYIGYISNNGLLNSFPECNCAELYSYEIRVVTDFVPEIDYIELIEKMNRHINKQSNKIKITYEVNNADRS